MSTGTTDRFVFICTTIARIWTGITEFAPAIAATFGLAIGHGIAPTTHWFAVTGTFLSTH
jgi:hypothetical protein